MPDPIHGRRPRRPRLAVTTALLLAAACASGDAPPITPPPAACTTTPPAALATYYAATVNRCGTALITALHGTINNQRLLGYTFARDSLYAFVDRGNRAAIVDLYTGREVPLVTTRATAAENSINTEHLWPRSRGAENDPALSDLHHLASSDETANSQRSNYPFGRVNGTVLWTSTAPPGQPTDVSRLGYASGSSGQIVFEPRPSVRGDVARALFYFYVRYNADRGALYSLTNFAGERAFLLQWHVQDPVDDYERTRNDLVFRAQGNRNPFIDWPELVTLIGTFPLN